MWNLFRRVVPRAVRRRLGSLVLSEIKASNKRLSDRIPKVALPPEAIAKTQLLISREAMLERLPKGGIVAELGVDEGAFSAKILQTCAPRRLILVDIWGSERYGQAKRRHVETRFHPEIVGGTVQIEIGRSDEVAARFPDQSFDWIYIDTDHSYGTTIRELEQWSPKITAGGIIAGHDYIVGNWDGMVRYGVIEAVYDFCARHHWEIVYLTMEHDNFPSFAIRRI